MAIEIDILIVFADRDNVPPVAQTVGWVSQFRDFLDTMLAQLLGLKVNIMLKGEHDSLTSPTLSNVGIVLAVMSDDFAQSAACKDHLETFSRSLDQPEHIRDRLFKINKSPVAVAVQPPKLQGLIGYDMYQIDPDTGEEIVYQNYFREDAAKQYWMEIVDLSYDLGDALAALRGQGAKPKRITKRKTIYIAQTGHDLKVQRNIISRELQRAGHRIFPTQALSVKLEEIQTEVRQQLSTCDMSIHLIGHDFGEVPEGTDRSLQDIQNQLASERGAEARNQQESFTRLIWIPPNLELANDRQKKFIENLRRDAESQEGTEILQVLLEDFKNIIREELADDGDKRHLDDSPEKSVYIMHDQADIAAVSPYIEVIKAAGFNILTPSFDSELLVSRQRHIENLRNLDAAIIFAGNVNHQWVRMKAFDLLKAPGFGRKKPIMGKAIVAVSGSNSRQAFQNLDLPVIDGDEKHSLESLRTFLHEFKR